MLGQQLEPGDLDQVATAYDAQPAGVDTVDLHHGGRRAVGLAAYLLGRPLAEAVTELDLVEVVGQPALVGGRLDDDVGQETRRRPRWPYGR